MAVTTTVLDILRGAYGRSLKNKAGAIASEQVELVRVVQRAEQGLFSFAARINPQYFGDQATVAVASSAWPLPETAEAVFRIEMPTGAEVAVVPIEDRLLEPEKPSVYFLGKGFRSVGGTSDPVAESLTMFYARRPATLTATTSLLDTLWPEAHNDLLIDEVAIYLAIKDQGSGRDLELKAIMEERDRRAMLFAAHLEHVVGNATRRHSPVILTPSIAPINSLLAGGSNLRLAA